MSKARFSIGLRILEAVVAVSSNRESLLPSLPPVVEVPSLLTDFRSVDRIDVPSKPDGVIRVREDAFARPRYRLSGTRAVFEGPFMEMTEKASDPRFSLWGNQGFLYRFVLMLLELKHRIFSFHACALYQSQRHRLFIVAGGAGSGKTVFLLSGLERGLALLATEMLHFRNLGKRWIWYKGSQVDNVRLETLDRHFSRFRTVDGAQAAGPGWLMKRALDLSSYGWPGEFLINPEIVILFPRVEEGRREFTCSPFRDEHRAAQAVFDNLGEKIGQSVVLYDRLPVPGLDRPDLVARRWRAAEAFVRHPKTVFCASVLSSPEGCWGELLDQEFYERSWR